MPFRFPYTWLVTGRRVTAACASTVQRKDGSVAHASMQPALPLIIKKKHLWSSATMARARLDALLAAPADRQRRKIAEKAPV